MANTCRGVSRPCSSSSTMGVAAVMDGMAGDRPCKRGMAGGAVQRIPTTMLLLIHQGRGGGEMGGTVGAAGGATPMRRTGSAGASRRTTSFSFFCYKLGYCRRLTKISQ
jgi:hypothetical protein